MRSSRQKTTQRLTKKEQLSSLKEEFPDITTDKLSNMSISNDIVFEDLLIKESGEQEYEFNLRKNLTLKIRELYPGWNMNTCVVLGSMINKQIWLDDGQDEKIEELIDEIVSRM